MCFQKALEDEGSRAEDSVLSRSSAPGFPSWFRHTRLGSGPGRRPAHGRGKEAAPAQGQAEGGRAVDPANKT